MRIAVISRDGVGVNERLHRALDCFVFDREGDRVSFVERRVFASGATRLFRDFLSLESTFQGCVWIVALGFNGEAKRELAARGFRLHEARGPVEGVIRALPVDSVGTA